MSFGVQQLVWRKILPSCVYPRNRLQNVCFAVQVRKYTFSNIFINRWDNLKNTTVCLPKILSHIFVRGFKDKDVLTKRCKDCYFQRLDGRWYVLCNTHPRHKQRQKIDEKSKWIITHSTHGVKKF